MGIEHFYWFVDRAVADPVLQMSWKDYLRKYPWKGSRTSFSTVEELLNFCLEPQPDADTVARVITECSLRWTLQHSVPSYFFLHNIVYNVPRLRKHCPVVGVEDNWADEGTIIAVAVHAYLEGWIGEKTLWAIYNITGSQYPRGWLKLTRAEYIEIDYALGYGATERPIFRWQERRSLTVVGDCASPL